MATLLNELEGPPIAQQSLRAMLTMAFATLGVIYSDIGTSPLYVMNGIFSSDLTEAPSEEDVLGAISSIVWCLTLIPLVKYAIIALRFGTGQGEGGPFALFTALYPRRDEEGDEIAAWTTMNTRTRTRDAGSLSEKDKDSKYPLHESWLLRFINLKYVHLLLMGVATYAVAATLSDGALTPAVSVVTAVEGLQVAQPSLTNGAITGISIAFLVCLYAAQVLGTGRISFIFAPIVLCWFGILAGSGIANITHHPGVWRAYDPSRMVDWFKRTGDFTQLNGVLLAVTGSEAFFACLGQFSAPSITTAFSIIVYPTIVLAYLGQGARLITDGLDVLPNIFYLTIPGATGGGLYWVTFVFAIMAAIIASQAMITASFSLVVQLMSFNALPAMRAIRTSNTHRGQVFIPSVCLLLCAGSVGLVGGFGTGQALTYAYGFAVTSVFLCTTIMLTVSMPIRRGWPIYVALGYFVCWGFFDGLLFAAALFKVPDGAYVPLGAAVILMSIFIFWGWAKGLEHIYTTTHRARLPSLLAPYKAPGDTSSTLELEDDDAPEVQPVARSTAIEIMPITKKLSTDEKVALDRGSSNGDNDAPEHEKGGDATPAYAPENTAHMMLRLVDKPDPLPRIPAFAIFHKKTSGAAAPASFETFIRGLPALPTVVIFLAVKYTAEPYFLDQQRYEVRKLRAVPGFYRATVKFGYREAIDLRGIGEALTKLIVSVEGRDSDENTADTISAIRAAARSAVTHILPSYEPVAAPITSRIPLVGPVASYVRSFLLESVYGSLMLLFPEGENYIASGDERKLRIQVQALL